MTHPSTDLPTGAPGAAGTPVIGLDLGGTKIAAALFDADGTVLARHTRTTPARDGAGAVLDALARAAAEVDPGRLAGALGVAAAGVVDPRSGLVTSATDSIRGWAGTALGTGLADRTGLPVACDNDVRATAGPELAALGGEHGSLLFAAIGTGVGGAVAVDGRMLHGASGIAGHLGHLPSPRAAGLPCTCGAVGHLEVIASGPGITAHYERLTGTSVDRLQTVAARAARGDALAVHAITTGATAAGEVLGGLANALGPDRVVVGGGVPRIGALYGDALATAFAAQLMPPLRGLIPRAPLFGQDAAVLGAAALTTTLPLHHPGATTMPEQSKTEPTKAEPVNAGPTKAEPAKKAQELAAALRGRLIVSCQAPPGDPMRDTATLVRLARSAVAGGGAAIRANEPEVVAGIVAAVDLPVIGLWKDGDIGVYITPTVRHALTIVEAGAAVVAADATDRPRADGSTFADLVAAVHEAGALVMADVSTLAEGVTAARQGADFVSTTLSGYVPGTPKQTGPDLGLVAALAAAIDVPVVAEGRINTPEEAAQALALGAHSVVVGTAITAPTALTARFVAGLPRH